MRNTAEVEDHNRMQRVLSFCTEHAVVHDLHQGERCNRELNIRQCGASPPELRGPQQIGRQNWNCGECVWAKQNPETEESEGEGLTDEPQTRRTACDGKSEARSKKQCRAEQNVDP